MCSGRGGGRAFHELSEAGKAVEGQQDREAKSQKGKREIKRQSQVRDLRDQRDKYELQKGAKRNPRRQKKIYQLRQRAVQ
jgi:hypothetical protein